MVIKRKRRSYLCLPHKAVAWAAWKGGRVHDGVVSRTKKSILIGYDMIPLIGLGAMEARLRQKGITIEKVRMTRCPVHLKAHGYVVAVHGQFDLESLEWTGNCLTREGAFRSACGYLASELEKQLSEEDYRLLNRAWMSVNRLRVKDFRQAQWVLDRLDIAIVAVRFRKADRP